MQTDSRVIVCVDDDPLILQMLSFQLGKNLNEEENIVECFDHPETVVDELKTIFPQTPKDIILVSDYQMPGMNGGELVKQFKEAFPESRCIMISGQANEFVVKDLLENGMLEKFIFKPWNENELMKSINSAN